MVLDALVPSSLIKSLLVFILSLRYYQEWNILGQSDVTAWILKLFAVDSIQSFLLLPRSPLPLVFRTGRFVDISRDSSSSVGVLRCFLPNAPATLLLAGTR